MMRYGPWRESCAIAVVVRLRSRGALVLPLALRSLADEGVGRKPGGLPHRASAGSYNQSLQICLGPTSADKNVGRQVGDLPHRVQFEP